MKCPICTRPIEPKTVITCRRCWDLLPGNERVALARMHRLGHDMTAKIAKLVRIMREKFPMLGPKINPEWVAAEKVPHADMRTDGTFESRPPVI